MGQKSHPTRADSQTGAGSLLLRALLVLDRPADVDLCLRELRQAGFEVSEDVVRTPARFRKLISSKPYDVVLSAYKLRNWTGLEALAVLRRHGADIPFLLVTDGLGEERAVKCLKRGAANCILKDRISRLPAAVRQALQEKARLTEQKAAEDALRVMQLAFDQAGDACWWVEEDGRIVYVNEAACRSLGYSREELLSMRVYDFAADVPPEAWPAHWQQIREGGALTLETRHRRKDGTVFPIELAVSYSEYKGKGYCCAISRDISERKQREEELRKAREELEIRVQERTTELEEMATNL